MLRNEIILVQTLLRVGQKLCWKLIAAKEKVTPN